MTWSQHWSVNAQGGSVLTEGIEWQDLVFKHGTCARGGSEFTITRLFFGRQFNSARGRERGLGWPCTG